MDTLRAFASTIAVAFAIGPVWGQTPPSMASCLIGNDKVALAAGVRRTR